tara:strand:+ start:6790 stop:9531 length:2742 start_codon:yes stop_codon:yes gene_type:complete
MLNKYKGFSMIEMIVVLAILAVIAVPLMRMLDATLNYWRTSQDSLKTSMDIHYLLIEMIDEINQIQSVSLVSDYDNEEAYLQYLDVSGNQNVIFLNTEDNKTLFSSVNDFDSDSVLYLDQDGLLSPLISNVTLFKFETFRENSELVRVVTPNNIGTISYDQINSVRFKVSVQLNDTIEYLEQLVDIGRDPLQFSGSLIFGNTENLFEEYEENGYVLDNISIESDENNVFYLSLTEREETVKILNKGDYFTTISDALEAAVSGDIVLVANKDGGYVENLIIPAGVSLEGGYDPITWMHDPVNQKTILISQSGILFEEGSVLMNNNTSISGFDISGEDLQFAILALNVDDVKIYNNNIDNVDNPIYLESVDNAEVFGNSVTANQYAFYANGVENSTVFRNRLNSNNALLKENVLMLNSDTILFSNNLVTNGYYCFRASQSLNIDIHNNIFRGAQNFGIVIKNLVNGTFKNNVILQNNVGISIIETEAGVFTNTDINYNLFLNNIYGHTLDLVLDGTNIQNTLSDFELNFSNPYFADLINFELLDSSVLIDAGSPDAAYNDLYFADNPSKGIARNDMGLYGGPNAGRIGYPKVVALDLTSIGQAVTLLTQSFPGDVITIPNGAYDIDVSLTFKPYQIVSGEGSFTTLLSNISGASMLNLTDRVFLTNFGVESNLNDAITVAVNDSVELRNLFFTGEQASVVVSSGFATFQYNSFHSVNNPVVIQNDGNVNFLYNVVNAALVGLTNQSTSTVSSEYNIFTSVDTLYSGLVSNSNDVQQDESVFWDESLSIYILKPTSNAVEIDTIRDAGALGFYQDSGSILFSEISSNIDRLYSTLSFDYLAVTDQKYAVSAIYVEFIDETTSYLLPDYIIIDQETVTTNTLTLPNNIASDSLYLKLHLYSYTFNHTPIVDTITLSW